MNIRIILALSTMIGITLGGLLTRQTEAGASQSFSRYDIAQATITAEEDSYQSPRKKRKLVKSSNSKPGSIFDLFNENETLADVKSKKRRNSQAAAAPIKNQLSRGAARRAEIKRWLTAEAALAKQRQAEEAERQRLAVAESRTEANLTDAEPIPAGERVKVGERDARVPMIRARLEKLGFLSEENSFAWMLGHPADKVSNPSDLEFILDKELSKAIKAFQKANRIKQTGRIDKATVAALNALEAAARQRQAEEERKAQEAALALEKQRQADEAERQRLAAEAAAKQRQVEEERKAQEAALALAKQRQADEAERQRLAAAKQRQVEEERKVQEAALALAKQRQAEEIERQRLAAAKQRQAEEAERQRLAAEAVAKQRQAEEERKVQEAALALAKQRHAEEERNAQEAALALAKQRQADEAERQRLAAEAAAKQRHAEEERKVQEAALALKKQRHVEEEWKAQEAALALKKQRQAEEAERLSDNKKVASIDSASEANEASSKSCNNAKSIIGKYGFEDIETKSCKGKIYHFSATRKGKRFSVKINPLTSELTEVKTVLSSAPE